MIYIDKNNFRCFVSQNAEGTRIPHEESFFDGKCQVFVEGYCCVPDGYEWTSSDGTVYPGKMIFPWKPYEALDSAQREHEKALIVDMQNALKKLGVTLDENVD